MTGKVNITCHVTPKLSSVLLLIKKLHVTAQYLPVISQPSIPQLWTL